MGKKRPPAGPPGIEEAVILALREGHREFQRFLSRRTRSMEEAEDILQDFYLKAIRNGQRARRFKRVAGASTPPDPDGLLPPRQCKKGRLAASGGVGEF
jgi:hypothetical protein